jgi:hypothetical protein
MPKTTRSLAGIVLALACTAQAAAAPLHDDFEAMLSGFQAYGEPGRTGIAMGLAKAGERTTPVKVQITSVAGPNFTLTRSLMFGPPELKHATYGFRLTGAGAGGLVYEVTQSPVGTQPAVTVRCRGQKNGPGRADVTFTCLRPEVEALGSLAEPSFTFTFRMGPPFAIVIGEGLDNVFSVDTNSDYQPRF